MGCHAGSVAEADARPDVRPYGLAIDRADNVRYADVSGYVGTLAARGGGSKVP